jgi:hypothetical protein
VKKATAQAERKRRAEAKTGPLTEDQVKQAVETHLEAQGWTVTVAWGRERGIDIDAIKRRERLVVEAKGEVAKGGAQQVNYFLGALGELMQRMDDPNARYGLALPGNQQYRGLMERLPVYGKERLGLMVFWVTRDAGGRLTVTVEQ